MGWYREAIHSCLKCLYAFCCAVNTMAGHGSSPENLEKTKGSHEASWELPCLRRGYRTSVGGTANTTIVPQEPLIIKRYTTLHLL